MDRIHAANLARVTKMKAQGQKAETILEMEPGLTAAVQEVFGDVRHDISAVAPSDPKAEMALLIARQGAMYSGGSGSAVSPIPAGEEIAA